MRRWVAGDEPAGRELVRRRLPDVARFFASKVGAAHDADDLTARTFELLLAKRHDFRGEASVRTFLFAIAHHVLLGWVRDRRRSEARVDLGSVSARDLGPSPSTLLHADRRRRALIDALRTIPLESQIVIELAHVEELSRSEIAAVLGIPEGTVASRLRRARTALAEALARGVAPDLAAASATDLAGWARDLRAMLSPPEAL